MGEAMPTPTTNAETHAKRMLELIEAVLEGRVIDGIESATIGGKQITKIPLIDLHALRLRYKAEVANEEKAFLLAHGIAQNGNQVRVRFCR